MLETSITKIPGVQGGEPVLRGTRTPVRTIVVLFRQTYQGDHAAVRRALPHLTTEQIDAALAYYAAHQPEIDDLIRQHRQALQGLTPA